MGRVEIKQVATEDVQALQEISIHTFYETFAAQNTAENMNSYLEESFNIERLTNELTERHSEFYFAILSSKVIGYLKLNFKGAQTDVKDLDAVEIERIYVLKEFHGEKVGQLLYNKALDIAQHRKAHYLWLGVWEKNIRAIQFYTKNGFKVFHTHIFKLGKDEQTDLMMKRDLTQ